MNTKYKDIELWLGDCLDKMNTIDANSIDLVVCDPPYKTTGRGTKSDFGGYFKEQKNDKNGGFEHNDLDLREALKQVYRIMKESAHGYLMVNNRNLISFHDILEEAGFKVFKTLVWAKNNCITNMFYMDSHEYIIFFRKGKAKKINNCGTKTVFHFDNPRNKLHPTEKPVELLEVLINNSSNEGDVVLDFTMGCGSTGVACALTKRKFIGIELDKKYFDIADNRLKNFKMEEK